LASEFNKSFGHVAFRTISKKKKKYKKWNFKKKDEKSKDAKKDIRKSHNRNQISLSFPPYKRNHGGKAEEKRRRRRKDALSSAVLMTVRKGPTNEGREEAREKSAKERKRCEENLCFLLRCCIFVFFIEPIWFHVGHSVHVVSDAGEFVHKGFEHG